MAFFVGNMIGVLLLGPFSDWFGRKTAYMTTLSLWMGVWYFRIFCDEPICLVSNKVFLWSYVLVIQYGKKCLLLRANFGKMEITGSSLLRGASLAAWPPNSWVSSLHNSQYAKLGVVYWPFGFNLYASLVYLTRISKVVDFKR